MAFQTGIPFRGNDNASGGFLLPPEQGEILVNGILVETGAIQIAGDARATNARRTNFPIWLGQPSAGPVGEGARKPVTGASLGQGSLNIKKFASIVLFTDEQIEDMMNGDLNVLVDAGVRQALSRSIDAHALGVNAGASMNASATGSVFDTTLIPAVTQALDTPVTPVLAAGQTGVILGSSGASNPDRLQKAVSAAMGVLEGNGYGDPTDMAVLVGFGFQKELRDARTSTGRPLYDGGTFAGQSVDPLYGLDRAHSTNLAALTQSAACTGTIGAAGALTVSGLAGTLSVGAPVLDASSNVLGYITAVASATACTVGMNPSGALTPVTSGTVAFVGQPVGVVAHKPNIHVRVRSDITVDTSNQATITLPDASLVNLFEDNLTAIRYELRLGTFIHDAARAVVPIWAVK